MIDDSIIEIQAEIACEDIACKSKFCWINASSGKHIVLTSVHFGTWVAAIVCDYTFSCRSTELIQLGWGCWWHWQEQSAWQQHVSFVAISSRPSPAQATEHKPLTYLTWQTVCQHSIAWSWRHPWHLFSFRSSHTGCTISRDTNQHLGSEDKPRRILHPVHTDQQHSPQIDGLQNHQSPFTPFPQWWHFGREGEAGSSRDRRCLWCAGEVVHKSRVLMWMCVFSLASSLLWTLHQAHHCFYTLLSFS